MNATQADPSPWAPRRWRLFILLVLTAQVGLVFWLSDIRLSTDGPAPAQTLVHVSWNPTEEAAPRPDRADPTLFALVTSEGFSRSAWLTIPRIEYEITNSPEPMHWLALPSETLADDFAEFVQTNLVAEDLMSGPIPPVLGQRVVPAPVVVAGTVLRVEGAMANRPLLPDQPLPVLSTPILTNSVVRVLVDSTGTVISAALLASSGVARADREALTFAKAARFAPATGPHPAEVRRAGGLDYGRLDFQWSRVTWIDSAAAAAKRYTGL